MENAAKGGFVARLLGRPGWPRRLLISAVVVAVFSVLATYATWSTFSVTTANGSNSVTAGTVTLTDNDGGNTLVMFNLSAMSPGNSHTGCTKVTYTGSEPATVHLYANTTAIGANLDVYLDLVVTRGTFSTDGGSVPSCTNFVPDEMDYLVDGGGAGIVYRGTLSQYRNLHTNWGNGLVDPPNAAVESWTTGESHVYKFQLTLRDDNNAQGLTTTATFSWEARGS